MSRAGRLAGIVVAGAALVGACGGGGDSDGDAPTDGDATAPSVVSIVESIPGSNAPPADDTERAAAQAAVDEWMALPAEEQAELVGRLDLDLATAVAAESGVEEALGGAEATRATLADHGAALALMAGELTPESLAAGLRRPVAQAEGPSASAGLFGGYLVVAAGSRAAIEATNDGKHGTRVAGHDTSDSPGKFEVTATDQGVTLVFEATYNGDGATTVIKTRAEMQPCPDTEGRFAVHATVDVDTVAGASAGQNGNLEVTVVGQVDDDANLLPDETTYSYEMHWGGLGMGAFVDISGSVTPGGSTASLDDYNWFTTKPEHFVTAQTLGPLLAIMVGHQVLDAAMAGVQSGRCVQLDVTATPGPTGLEPRSTSTITATPRARRDGNPAGGTVTATLVAGAKSVEPSSTKLPAPAEFTFNAPDERNQTGTVALESRSRRGVGKATIDFDTAGTAYVASGTADEASFSGEVASITEPFQIDIEFIGGSGVFTFQPGDEHGGTVSIVGAGSGATLSGSGTYVAAANEDGTVTLTVQSNSCVDVSGVCRDSSAVITLTPKAPT